MLRLSAPGMGHMNLLVRMAQSWLSALTPSNSGRFPSPGKPGAAPAGLVRASQCAQPRHPAAAPSLLQGQLAATRTKR